MRDTSPHGRVYGVSAFCIPYLLYYHVQLFSLYLSLLSKKANAIAFLLLSPIAFR